MRSLRVLVTFQDSVQESVHSEKNDRVMSLIGFCLFVGESWKEGEKKKLPGNKVM